MERTEMTKQKFYEKYKDVDFYFSHYYKYTFTFKGDYEGKEVFIGVGGNSDEIYRFEVGKDVCENILNLQPYEGVCGEDSFYDW